MDYPYFEIQGKIIDINDLNIARAKSIALAAFNNPIYILNPIFIKRGDNAEIIRLSLDVEIPQHTQNDIREQEDIAIICYSEDEYFPEVYALRNDFPLGLPHTNLRINDYPVSLCVSEQNFQEVKHKFNAFEFIESVRHWFSLISKNKLHAEDQPLEPFFFPNGFVVMPKSSKIDIDNFYIEQYADNKLLYKIQPEDNGKGKYFCFPINADEQISGYIRQKPQKIKDLANIVTVNQKNISIYLSQIFNKLNDYLLSDKVKLQKKIAFCCFIPVKRKETNTKSERTDILLFVTEKTLREIGIENDVWAESTDKNNGYNSAPSSKRSFELERD